MGYRIKLVKGESEWLLEIVRRFELRSRVEFGVNIGLPGQRDENRILMNITGQLTSLEIEAVDELGKLPEILDNAREFVSYEVSKPVKLQLIDDSDSVVREYTGKVQSVSVRVGGGEDIVYVNIEFVVGAV